MSDTNFKPAGPVRPNSIYTNWRLYKALGYASRKLGQSREDVVESVLQTWITEHHPEIEAWLTKCETDEKAFVKTLTPMPAPEPRE